jgi:tRNA-binding protein
MAGSFEVPLAHWRIGVPRRALRRPIPLSALEALDIRVGRIVAVEDVAGSSKLGRLLVDFGDRRRSILAGLKRERANPGELLGVQALFVVNLPPRKMAGEVSEGMLFDIGYSDGLVPVLATPEKPVQEAQRLGRYWIGSEIGHCDAIEQRFRSFAPTTLGRRPPKKVVAALSL